MLRGNEPKHAESGTLCDFIAWWDQAVGVRHGLNRHTAENADRRSLSVEDAESQTGISPARQSAGIAAMLEDLGPIGPKNERQSRPLASLPTPELQAQEELSRQGVKGDGFVAWIESETKYSCSSAYNLINVSARFKDKPRPNFGRSVLYALAAPSTPDAVVEKAVAKVESGEKVTVADVRDWKSDYESERQARELFERRAQESQAESNERRKKIRELETQVDLLKAAAPEVQVVEKAPADYDAAKALAQELAQDLDAFHAALESIQFRSSNLP